MKNIGANIAENLKRLRQERNLSLSRLAELAQVSKVILSQIEKGDTNPTINTIWKIAKGLQVPYTLLIDEHQPDTQVITRADAQEQSSEDGTYRISCYFQTALRRSFELFRLDMEPHSSYTSIGHTDKSREYILVGSGSLVLDINGRRHILQAGDALTFDASAPHAYINEEPQPMTATIINDYPAE